MSTPIHKDMAGQSYTGPTSAPANAGTTVTIHTNNGPVQGPMVGGGYVVPNKTS